MKILCHTKPYIFNYSPANQLMVSQIIRIWVIYIDAQPKILPDQNFK